MREKHDAIKTTRRRRHGMISWLYGRKVDASSSSSAAAPVAVDAPSAIASVLRCLSLSSSPSVPVGARTRL